MKKIILTIIAIILIMVSCTKEAEMNIYKEPSFPPEANKFRAIKIEGHNAHWGDYTWLLTYENNRLKTAVRMDAEGDTIGAIQITRSSDVNYRFQVNDWVPSVDANSIKRLDNKLEALYGKGNYSLKDSIPRASATWYEVTVELLNDGRLSKQTRTYYRPRYDNGLGDDFEYSYWKIQSVIENYEYDEKGRLIASREFMDTYDTIQTEVPTRTLHKKEFTYQGNVVSNILFYDAPAGSGFQETDNWKLSWNGKELHSITATSGKNRIYTWENGKLSTITESEKSSRYEWNANGYLSNENNPDGSWATVTYEEGNGNLSWFIPTLERITDIPFIK